MQTVFLGADHAGFESKEVLKRQLEEAGYIVVDKGAFELIPDDDYPDFAKEVALAVIDNPESKGILLCGSGHGVCVAANKFAGIRAALGYSAESIATGRADDDVNVLCLPARFLEQDSLFPLSQVFLEEPFKQEERYMRRLQKIESIEEDY